MSRWNIGVSSRPSRVARYVGLNVIPKTFERIVIRPMNSASYMNEGDRCSAYPIYFKLSNTALTGNEVLPPSSSNDPILGGFYGFNEICSRYEQVSPVNCTVMSKVIRYAPLVGGPPLQNANGYYPDSLFSARTQVVIDTNGRKGFTNVKFTATDFRNAAASSDTYIGSTNTKIASFIPKQNIVPVESTQQIFVPAASQDGKQWFSSDHFAVDQDTSKDLSTQPKFGGAFAVHQSLQAAASGFNGAASSGGSTPIVAPVLYIQDTIRLTCHFRGDRQYLETKDKQP